MKFYDDTKTLYLETDASVVGLGAVLLSYATTLDARGMWHQIIQGQSHSLVKV